MYFRLSQPTAGNSRLVQYQIKRSRSGADSGSRCIETPLHNLLDHESERRRQQSLHALVEVLGVKFDDSEQHHALADVGIDSSSSAGLKQKLEEALYV